MSKEELKTALSGLNVSRPLKIAATAPVFQALNLWGQQEPRFNLNLGSPQSQVKHPGSK